MKISIIAGSTEQIPERAWEVVQQAVVDCPSADFILLPAEFLGRTDPLASADLRAKVQLGLSELARSKGSYIVGGALLAADGKQSVSYFFDKTGTIVHTQSSPFIGEQKQSGNYFSVIETEFGRIGILNGNDIWVWESSRILSLKGAEILFVPTQLGHKNAASKIASLWGLATLNCVAIAFASAPSATSKGFATVILPSGVLAQSVEDGSAQLQAEILPGQMAKLRDADLTFANTLWFGLWSRRKQLYGPLVQEAPLAAAKECGNA